MGTTTANDRGGGQMGVGPHTPSRTSSPRAGAYWETRTCHREPGPKPEEEERLRRLAAEGQILQNTVPAPEVIFFWSFAAQDRRLSWGMGGP